MFNPIYASNQIKEDFIGYITTRFRFADTEYAAKFKAALHEEGLISKGPYLDITDTFESGKSLESLIGEGVASRLFRDLEPNLSEKQKEIKLERPLYAHQEKALRKVNEGRNIVVTTGTGSGKTECFILPIINHLLKERERGCLTPGVRAILIYPMNALANDQMKRLRDVFRDYPDITFGVYNGSTAEERIEGEDNYRKLFKDKSGNPGEPLSNEILSRRAMRETPPHILVTNYAMLEYMLLRPNDDKVFSGSRLRFLVLDEAHTYRGATGIETALLLRRLKARIGDQGNVSHILTSATLGGEDANADIVAFAKTLCEADFTEDDIIRSKTVRAESPDELVDYPSSLFVELAFPERPLNEVLDAYGVPFDSTKDEDEILYDLCLSSRLYASLRGNLTEPMPIKLLVSKMEDEIEVSEKELASFIHVASRALKGKTPLMKARYHMFLRALEGAYTAYSEDKPLLLTGVDCIDRQGVAWPVFELAVCSDCGRVALAGIEDEGIFRKSADVWDDGYRMIVPSKQDEVWDDFELESSSGGASDLDYLLCTQCGEIHHASQSDMFGCAHGESSRLVFREARKTESGSFVCPCCERGNLVRFYIGYDSATSVLGTSLFEVLPEKEVVLELRDDNSTETDNPFFAASCSQPLESVKKCRQFLAFSDSRSDAAYFASRMDAFYKEFIRRRGIWHVVEENREDIAKNPWGLGSLVSELTAYFNSNRSFAEPGIGVDNLTAECRRQSWIAVLNEIVNAGRATSLVSLGVIDFHYKGNSPEMMRAVGGKYGLSEDDATALFDQLVLTIAQNGALESKDCSLTDDDREYIFYTTSRVRFVCQKEGDRLRKTQRVKGWLPCRRESGSFFMNSRMRKLMKVLDVDEGSAYKLLEQYWTGVLNRGDCRLEGDSGERWLDASSIQLKVQADRNKVFVCDRCGKITLSNCRNLCPTAKCDGTLREANWSDLLSENHYVRLYSSSSMSPLHIKEHTAQLDKREQQNYQQMFVDKEINALSCSTTFEMGVDVGDLEAVYLRNMPPSPANYVQRAGRAGRNVKTAAFSLTYAKLGSHDFTFYKHPEKMIVGNIGVPLFNIANERIVRRHINAVAMSGFFSAHPEVYDSNNAYRLLHEGGFEKLIDYLNGSPSEVLILLKDSIPDDLHERFGINDWSWKEKLVGDDGSLTVAVLAHRGVVEELREETERHKADSGEQYVRWLRKLKDIRRAPGDNRGKNDLIEFLVRNNILPKYGFPVDTVELHEAGRIGAQKKVQLMRDLQLAVSEYAPGSQVVADGKLYTSRYIRKLPQVTGRDWDEIYIARCGNDMCRTWNRRLIAPSNEGEVCLSCGSPISNSQWEKAIEPRNGFVAEENPREVPLRSKPERAYRSDDYYIGDTNRKEIRSKAFRVSDELSFKIESSSEDALLVVCNDDFFVCPWCGYSENSRSAKGPERYKRSRVVSHKTSWGKRCGNNKLYRNKLCHTFKTDVVRLTFACAEASDYGTMISTLYALLEGMSKELAVERTDIKGCLHVVRLNGCLVHELVLYDAAAGGAGHVRRLLGDDCNVLRRVVDAAVGMLEECSCEPSCYSCLRNYYNRNIHDRLERCLAIGFLKKLQYRYEEVPIESFERDDRAEGAYDSGGALGEV